MPLGNVARCAGSPSSKEICEGSSEQPESLATAKKSRIRSAGGQSTPDCIQDSSGSKFARWIEIGCLSSAMRFADTPFTRARQQFYMLLLRARRYQELRELDSSVDLRMDADRDPFGGLYPGPRRSIARPEGPPARASNDHRAVGWYVN